MASILEELDAVEFPEDLSPDFSDEFEQDLPSAAMGQPSGSAKLRAKLKPTGDLIPAGMKRRLNAEIELYLELLNGVCEMRCERCAKVVEQHLQPLAKRLTNIVARYPELAEKLVTGGLLGDWIALLGAARPIAKQLVGHHVTHSIAYPEDEGPDGDGIDLDQYGPYRPA